MKISRILVAAGLAAATAVPVAAAPASAALPYCSFSFNAWVGTDRVGHILVELPAVPLKTADPYAQDIGYRCLMKRGSTVQGGNAVRALQYNLNDCYGYRLSPDGSFGPATQAALIAVQGRIGVVRDGIYGPKTAAAMAWRPFYGETSMKPGEIAGSCRRYSSVFS